MTRKQSRRLAFAAALFAAAAGGTALVLAGLGDNMYYYMSPSDLASRHVEPGKTIRVGGLVETGSLEAGDGLLVRFAITDGAARIPVRYSGLLPDLFSEGQGVVAMGALEPDGALAATEILARHDETYMPAEVADALKRAGQWRGEASE